jgi:hypothetical protein
VTSKEAEDEQRSPLTQDGAVADDPSVVRLGNAEADDRPPLLTPTDVDRLAEAIRRGSAQDGPSPRRMAATAAVAVVFLAVELVVLNYLLTSRPSQRLSVSTSQLDALRHVTMSDGAAGGRWALQPAEVQSIGMFDPRGTIAMAIPVAASRCDQLATRLGSTCANGAIVLSPPVQLQWSRAVRVVGSVEDVSKLDVSLSKSGSDPRQFTLDLVTTSTGSATNVCVSQPNQPTRLALVAGSTTTPLTFPAGARPLPCSSGVTLLVGHGDPTAAGTTSLELRGVRSVNLAASGTSADLNSVAGDLTLVGVNSRVLDPPAHVIVAAAASHPLAASLLIDRVEQRASVTSDGSTSVLTDDGQFLPTQWDRRSQIYLPVLAGVFSVLVLSPLAIVIPWMMGLAVGKGSARTSGAKP